MNSSTALLLRMPNEREMRIDFLLSRIHQFKSLYTMPLPSSADRDNRMSNLLDDIDDILVKIEEDIDVN
jgi:hypothetical protein